MSAYFKVFSTIAKGVKKLKGNKSKVSPTIKSVKPASGSLTKRRKDTEEVMKIRTRHGTAPNKRTSDTIKKISKLNDDIDRTRVRKMGGGMMGRRMGYSEGSKGKVPTTPKEKSLAKLAPPRNKITFGDVVAGRTKGKRMQAKDGTNGNVEKFMKPLRRIENPEAEPMRDRKKQPLKIKKKGSIRGRGPKKLGKIM